LRDTPAKSASVRATQCVLALRFSDQDQQVLARAIGLQVQAFFDQEVFRLRADGAVAGATPYARGAGLHSPCRRAPARLHDFEEGLVMSDYAGLVRARSSTASRPCRRSSTSASLRCAP
jgi:hypothetical protein